jgi:hypothetical protein
VRGLRFVDDTLISLIMRARKFQRHEASMREWIDLLAISTRFDFQRIRECAIDAIENSRWEHVWRPGHLNNIDPIEQILLVEKHDIPVGFVSLM